MVDIKVGDWVRVLSTPFSKDVVEVGDVRKVTAVSLDFVGIASDYDPCVSAWWHSTKELERVGLEDAAESIPPAAAEAGLRKNEGKLPYHLLPADAIQEVVKVLQKGAEKYAERNWQKGLKWDSQCASSLDRHLAKWRMGEDTDPEDGMLHIAKVMVNAMFLTHFYLNKTGEDDRYVYRQDV